MPAYNAAGHLAEAVSSVLVQTMRNLELIVVDDGSEDATPLVLGELAVQDQRIVILRQANAGIGAAMNAALMRARADYVAILDSDDVMEPERLAIQAAFLDDHPDIAAVGSQWYTMNPAGGITGVDRHAVDPDVTRVLMFCYFALHHPTIMARRQALLDCGAYPVAARHGAPDYELFVSLALAGYRLANLPLVLTRWRLNPLGVTQSKAVAQTANAAAVRESAFARLSAASPEDAEEIATALVRMFPAGSWFDEKVERLLPSSAVGPVLARWKELAVRDVLPRLEVVAVDWLRDEVPHADALAAELQQAALPWLAELVRARSGGALAHQEFAESGADKRADPACPLSVLVPTHARDEELAERVRSALTELPDGGEVVVFGADAAGAVPVGLPTDHRLRVLPGPVVSSDPWRDALAAVRGRHLAWLEVGQRHHHEFLARGVEWLDAHPLDDLVYVPSDLFYRDALDPTACPVKDPAPEPRWSRETLLGRDRARLGCMVHRREALSGLPLDLRQAREMAGWALARWLVMAHRTVLLDLRNTERLPPIRLGNNILATVTRRLITWYLDSGLGNVPAQHAWVRLPATEAQRRLRNAGALLNADRLCLYPGNAQSLVEFACRYAGWVATSPAFRAALARDPRSALAALRRRRPLQVPIVLAGWLGGRLVARIHRSIGRSRALDLPST